MNLAALVQAGARELLPPLQAAWRRLSDGEVSTLGSMPASPSKVSPAAWQHTAGAGTLPSCHQPFLAPMQGKAGTDRASVNFNSPYCPELALTMHRGAACH